MPDRDRPDPNASPPRYEYLSRDEQEVRQALADWFQVPPSTNETRNLHTAESLLGDILSKLPLDGEGMDPELLREGWLKAAGPFLGQQPTCFPSSRELPPSRCFSRPCATTSSSGRAPCWEN